MIRILLAAALLQHAHGAGHADSREASAPSHPEGARHNFQPLPDGGLLEVVSGERDSAQVGRVRDHLRAEAAEYARGDFRGEAAGAPGLAELAAGAKRIEIAYADTDGGGRIRFITSDPALVRALHAWLSAHVRGHQS